jgi:predicted ATPase/DNA-binding SARP family transcriptional activator
VFSVQYSVISLPITGHKESHSDIIGIVMSDLSLSFLGSFAASFDGQSLLPFRAKSVQALLIYLVCETERAHQRETLMDLFWPGMPLDSAQANLRQTLYRLRQAIPEARSSEAGTTVPFVLADRRTIQINPEAVYQADVQQLAELIDHDPEQAINLYRGDFLADFYLPDSETFEEWVNGRRAHTQRLILTALDEVTAVHLQNGRYDEAENLARRQLTIDNLLESGHRQLMESLARNGRRRAALSHYESLSQLLQAELDITPSSATQALVQAIRAGELAERGERREENVESVKVEIEQPPLSTPHLPLPASTPRHNLPAQATPFIGRETELEELGKLIANPPTSLTTIVGPGGMGKTRLALATAERILKGIQFPDGVFFVDLAPLNEAPQIPEAVAKALEIQFGGEEQLLEFLRDKAMFFILDNFEHVLAGAQWVNTILTTAPGVQVLVTSRERLGLRGEQLFQIPGLDFPDWITPENASDYNAARLFLGAAQRLRSDFVLTEVDLPSLTHICQLVGGMPLALELAAGWVELLSLAEIAAEIEQGLDFLETELQDVPERQRSMQTVFSTTWERLELAEQEMLRKLSVFRGGFTREAAAQVAYGGGSAAATLKLLGRLVNKSLLQTNPSQGRYQLHELLRQYAAEQLEKAGETESTRTTHADFFVEMAHQLEGEIKGGRQQKEALDAIEADLANIQAAWDWALIQGDLAAIVRSLEALSWFNQFRQAVDVRQMYQRVQTLLPQGSERYANPLWRRITLFFPRI